MDLRGVVLAKNDGDNIVGIWLDKRFLWPDPWTDIWTEESTRTWETVWRDAWSATYIQPTFVPPPA